MKLIRLENNHQELNNLIGRNPNREKHRAEVERMKGLLVEWLARAKSPRLETVKARPLFNQLNVNGPRL
jgi:hypothetical protein